MPYLIKCWNCMAEYDAVETSFCNHHQPTKVCPYCFNCFCDSSDTFKDIFWQSSPQELIDERDLLERKTAPKLGEILIKAGRLTQEQLNDAMEKQKVHRKRLGETLVMMGLLTFDELQLYLLDQKVIEEIDLPDFKVNLDLIEKFGKDFCIKHYFIPLEYFNIGKEKILKFALLNPEEIVKIRQNENLKNAVLIPHTASKQQLDQIIGDIKNIYSKNDVFVLEQEMSNEDNVIGKIIQTAINNHSSDIFFELKNDNLDIGFLVGDTPMHIDIPIEHHSVIFNKIKEVSGFRTREPYQESLLHWDLFKEYRIKSFFFIGETDEYIRLSIINLKHLKKPIDDCDLSKTDLETIRSQLLHKNGLYIITAPQYNLSQETMYSLIKTIKNDKIVAFENDILLKTAGIFQFRVENHQITETTFDKIMGLTPNTLFLFGLFIKKYANKIYNFASQGKLFLEINDKSGKNIIDKLSTETGLDSDFLNQHLRLIINHKEIRFLCPECKNIDTISENNALKQLNIRYMIAAHRGNGCDQCHKSGYVGKKTLYEIYTPASSTPMHQKNSIKQQLLKHIIKGNISYKEYLKLAE